MPDKLLDIYTRPGEEIHSDGLSLIPFAQSVVLRPPGAKGGLVWTRPVSVLVRHADGREIVLPVHDLTRRWQIGLLAAGLFGGLFLLLINKNS
jgi:hypothetical protein